MAKTEKEQEDFLDEIIDFVRICPRVTGRVSPAMLPSRLLYGRVLTI